MRPCSTCRECCAVAKIKRRQKTRQRQECACRKLKRNNCGETRRPATAVPDTIGKGQFPHAQEHKNTHRHYEPSIAFAQLPFKFTKNAAIYAVTFHQNVGMWVVVSALNGCFGSVIAIPDAKSSWQKIIVDTIARFRNNAACPLACYQRMTTPDET
jgi:hypothetical protein